MPDTDPGPAGAADRRLRRDVMRLAGPMTLAGTAGVLVPTVVLALVSRLGPDEMSVRALYTPLAFLFLAVQMAFDLSNQAGAAFHRGQGTDRNVPAHAVSLLRVWVGIGVVIGALLAVAAPALTDALQVEPEVRPQFEAFLRWMAAANLTLPGSVLAASCLRGTGRARAAASITLTNAVVEIAGVAVLGHGTGLGIMAVPVATALAGLSGTLLGLAHLRRAGLWGRPLGWRPDALRRLLSVGLPVGVSYLVLFAMNLALLWVLSPFGRNIRDGFAVGVAVQSLVIIPAIALGSATAIIMNQHRGAGRLPWLDGTLRAGLRVTFVVYAALVPAVWLGRDVIGRLMAGDTQVAEEGVRYLGVVAPTYLVFGMVLVAVTAIEQVGGGLVALGLNTGYTVGIIGVGGLLARRLDDPGALYMTIALLNLAGLAGVVVAIRFVRGLSRSQPSAPEPRARLDLGKGGR
ncbi:MATE family efflux transporter [Actinomadura xylanilytica]|uniref:MATE family efflux transporter n=1 Tax=Actinomadura xylanilytica TaxID=887459 RepID=UPI00255AE6E1|nr:MATE family efflux transporter [Actinomadura xylanilytica]MDL4774220.1 MATE family efflux transporter [Actinomadura xylanilytica]